MSILIHSAPRSPGEFYKDLVNLIAPEVIGVSVIYHHPKIGFFIGFSPFIKMFDFRGYKSNI